MSRIPEEPIASSLSDLTSAGLPLASGVRALADEAPTRSERAAFRKLSQRLEQGESLEQALTNDDLLSASLRGVLRAAARSGNFAEVMSRHLQLRRQNQEQKADLWLNLTYSFLLVLASAAVVLLLLTIVVPQTRSLFDDFGLEVPTLTSLILAASRFILRYGLLVLFVGGALLLAGGVLVRWFIPRAMWSRGVSFIPGIGQMVHSFGVARFCQVLATLREGQIPLPESLKLAGEASGNAAIDRAGERMADHVAHGLSLVEAAEDEPAIPRELLPIFRCHDRGPAFSEALQAAGEMFISRSNTSVGLVTLVIEPVVILITALVVGTTVIALFMPLLRLMNELS